MYKLGSKIHASVMENVYYAFVHSYVLYMELLCVLTLICLDVRDAALDWVASYYANRTQVVVVGKDSSFVSELRIGAPQGSVFGPRSFFGQAEDVTNVFEQHRVRQQSVCWRHAGHQAQQAVQRLWRHYWPWSLCYVCEQLVSVEAPSAEHQENRGDVVCVCNKPQENLVCRQGHSRRIRHHITIFCCPWSRSVLRLRTQHEVAY